MSNSNPICDSNIHYVYNTQKYVKQTSQHNIKVSDMLHYIALCWCSWCYWCALVAANSFRECYYFTFWLLSKVMNNNNIIININIIMTEWTWMQPKQQFVMGFKFHDQISSMLLVGWLFSSVQSVQTGQWMDG